MPVVYHRLDGAIVIPRRPRTAAAICPVCPPGGGERGRQREEGSRPGTHIGTGVAIYLARDFRAPSRSAPLSGD
jgi:hypothetical protein